MAGLAMFGLGIALLIDANLGAAPWDVFHTGVSELTGMPVGTVIIVTGVLLLLLWIPLGESPGLGTILNAFEIGLVRRRRSCPSSPSPSCSCRGW